VPQVFRDGNHARRARAYSCRFARLCPRPFHRSCLLMWFSLESDMTVDVARVHLRYILQDITRSGAVAFVGIGIQAVRYNEPISSCCFSVVVAAFSSCWLYWWSGACGIVDRSMSSSVGNLGRCLHCRDWPLRSFVCIFLCAFCGIFFLWFFIFPWGLRFPLFSPFIVSFVLYFVFFLFVLSL